MSSELHDERPIRVPEFRVELRADDSLLVETSGDRLLSLNDSAIALWDLCDGSNTVDEMVEAIVELFGAQVADVRTDVTATIAQLHEAGAIDYSRA